MNMAETVTGMRRLYEAPSFECFSDPARRRAPSAQTGTGVRRGRVTTMLTHEGIASMWRWSCPRYCEGVSPTISVKRELNEPRDVHPTAKHVSVTDIPWRRNDL